jgi:hypothetical protein
VAVFFRDHAISDRIGFVYARMAPLEAVEDFVRLLEARRDAAALEPGVGAPPVVTVALDGENAWEYFPNGGYDFLDALYARLESLPWLRCVTPTSYLQDHAEALAALPELPALATGSWIDGHFGTWIGDPAKNAAWEALGQARRTVGAACRASLSGELHSPDSPEANLASERAREAMDCLLLAEASDWFWWFGKGHTSLEDAAFDALFRRHLRTAYTLVGLKAPPELDTPIDPKNRPTPSVGVETHAFVGPSGLIAPRITGRIESYYEWIGAGRYELEQGALHQTDPLLRRMRFGIGRDPAGELRLYVRIDGTRPLAESLGADDTLVIGLVRPKAWSLRVVREPSGAARLDDEEAESIEVAIGRVLEAAVPLRCLDGALAGGGRGEIELYVSWEANGREFERLPRDRNVIFTLDAEALEMDSWHV